MCISKNYICGQVHHIACDGPKSQLQVDRDGFLGGTKERELPVFANLMTHLESFQYHIKAT